VITVPSGASCVNAVPPYPPYVFEYVMINLKIMANGILRCFYWSVSGTRYFNQIRGYEIAT
jgi:hypothetical protein